METPKIKSLISCYVDLDSSVIVVTRYGLNGPGIESQWGARFSAAIRVFPRVKRLGHGIDHPPPSSTEVKERAEIYLYSTSGPSWPVIG